ncbi:hypothetical protein GCM10010435_02720 [Winogradskya consettensis]|uniref:N-acetyltransferase domain-containing protein n=1 Tax=Winogradskya consettensis TaxID=113560 RepID=A0A919VK04_9ACTN|nr:GNAT family N-acetyltransferase [Actinoplanes consettensis]GIM66051.1 hypothetical protein Aco04nite_00230 [Actinoplanes consettensis]
MITPAHPTDVPRLLQIRRVAFEAQAPVADSPREVETLLADVDPAHLVAMAASGRLFVARIGEVITGLAGWEDDRLRHVYVDPPFTRQGIGSALLHHVEHDFRTRTAHPAIYAGVAMHARDFYRANGYVLDRQAVAWDGSAYLEMSKPLRRDG